MSIEKTETGAALDYVVNTTDICYNNIYEMAKEMDKDQLLNLLDSILLSTKGKDKLIAERVYDSNNTELAVAMANITQNYTAGIHEAAVQLLQNKRNTQPKEFGEELPGDIIR